MSLDSTDRKILNTLQENARMSNADLAEAINLSASACLRRVRQLEKTASSAAMPCWLTRRKSASQPVYLSKSRCMTKAKNLY